MDSMRLGPNGGLLYAVQFVRTNLAWLDTQLAAVDQGAYLMFDCPGQVELFTADSNMKVRILNTKHTLIFIFCDFVRKSLTT